MDRPENIECPDWEALSGASNPKTCKFYSAGGKCGLPVRDVCTEWERAMARRGSAGTANAGAPLSAGASDPRTLPAEEPTQPSALSLLAVPGASQAPQSGTIRSVVRGALADAEGVGLTLVSPQGPPKSYTSGRDTLRGSPTPVPLHGLPVSVRGRAEDDTHLAGMSERSILALEESGAEVTLETPALNEPLILVGALTGRKDRVEMTFRSAALLAFAVDALDATVVEIRPPSREEK